MRVGVALCCGVALLVAQGTRGESVAIDGIDSARMIAPAGVVVEPYRNAGYELTVRDGEVVVRVDAHPLESTAPFVAPAPAADAMGRLAVALVRGSRDRYEAVSRILGWVSREIRYELDRGASQEPEAVLSRRRGYCTGVARLSVALLRAAGIEAREVAGWVVNDRDAGATAVYHRWIEAFYPDRGWEFSDPLVTHHYVPANYLRLGSERLDPSQAEGGLLLERRDEIEAVDTYRWGSDAVRARRNSALQEAGCLRVDVPGDRAGTATLAGEGLLRTSAVAAGRGFFVGLAPGQYALRVELRGGGTLERRLRIGARVRSVLSFPPGAGLAVEGQSR